MALYKEIVELTSAHVHLSPLTEAALMRIAHSVIAHSLIPEGAASFSSVHDANGQELLLGNYFYHLSIPEPIELAQYRLWERLNFEVEVSSFKWLAAEADISIHPPKGIDAPGPSMTCGMMFWPIAIDGSVDSKSTCPDPERIRPVQELRRPPLSQKKFVQVRSSGSVDQNWNPSFLMTDCFQYEVLPVRDVPVGRGMYPFLDCTALVDVMDMAEIAFLEKTFQDIFSDSVIGNRVLVERTAFFFEHCRSRDLLSFQAEACFDPIPSNANPDEAGRNLSITGKFQIKVRLVGNPQLIAFSSYTKKFGFNSGDAFTAAVSQIKKGLER